MSGAHVPDVHTIKCENPFPNWKPITKISYLELDIIVSRLVYSKAINWLMESSNINIINHFWRLILMIHTCLIDELLCMINNAIALSMLLSFREWVNTIIKIQKTNIFLSMFQCKINGDYTYVYTCWINFLFLSRFCVRKNILTSIRIFNSGML